MHGREFMSMWLSRAAIPAALLGALLQRVPATLGPRMGAESALPSILAVARSFTLGVAVLGAVDALAGPTMFEMSEPNPVRGVVGEPLAVAFTINAAPSRPNRFFLRSPLPPGLSTVPAASGDRIPSGTPAIVGTPTQAGTFSVLVTGSDGRNEMDGAVIFEIAPAPAGIASASLLTSVSPEAPVLLVASLRGGEGRALLARAIGPSLAAVGVAEVAQDPALALRRGDSTVAENDDWEGDAVRAAAADAGALPLAGPGSRDAAVLVRDLAAGEYAVEARAADASGGRMLIELHAVSSSAASVSPRLSEVNATHRSKAGEAFTLGFVLNGETAPTIRVRATGASDPLGPEAQILLFNATGTLLALSERGPEPEVSLAIVLPAGAYTAQLRHDGDVEIRFELSATP